MAQSSGAAYVATNGMISACLYVRDRAYLLRDSAMNPSSKWQVRVILFDLTSCLRRNRERMEKTFAPSHATLCSEKALEPRRRRRCELSRYEAGTAFRRRIKCRDNRPIYTADETPRSQNERSLPSLSKGSCPDRAPGGRPGPRAPRLELNGI